MRLRPLLELSGDLGQSCFLSMKVALDYWKMTPDHCANIARPRCKAAVLFCFAIGRLAALLTIIWTLLGRKEDSPNPGSEQG